MGFRHSEAPAGSGLARIIGEQADERPENTVTPKAAQRSLTPSRATKIVLHNWGSRVVVTVEPRTVNRPSQPFRTETDALAFAEKIRRREGWPIEDRRS